MTFGEKLRELREAKGWTQKVLADAAVTNQQSVGRWETGAQVPGFDAVQALCGALGVPCAVFDGCGHAKVEDSRGRGRPPKADASEAKPAPAAKRGRPKKGGA